MIRPGGYFCLRTPNKRSYFGLAAALIPNWLHERVTRKAQNGRREEDVFPTLYRCNTRRRLRNALCRNGFTCAIRCHEAEPAYLSFSPIAYWLGVLHQRIAPEGIKMNLFAFARRRGEAACVRRAGLRNDMSTQHRQDTLPRNTPVRWLHEGIWVVAAQGAMKAAGLLSGIIVARYLGGTIYGGFAVLVSTLAMIVAIVSLGFGVGLTRSAALWNQLSHEVARSRISAAQPVLFGYAVAIASVCFMAACLWENLLGDLPAFSGVLLGGTVLVFLVVVAESQSCILIGAKQFRAYAENQLVFSIVYFGSIAFAVRCGKFGYLLGGVLIAYALVALLHGSVLARRDMLSFRRLRLSEISLRRFSVGNIRCAGINRRYRVRAIALGSANDRCDKHRWTTSIRVVLRCIPTKHARLICILHSRSQNGHPVSIRTRHKYRRIQDAEIPCRGNECRPDVSFLSSSAHHSRCLPASVRPCFPRRRVRCSSDFSKRMRRLRSLCVGSMHRRGAWCYGPFASPDCDGSSSPRNSLSYRRDCLGFWRSRISE